MRLKFNQLSAIHSTSGCLCEAFCLGRSEWIRGEGGATVGVWVGATEAFGQSLPDTWQFAVVWSERCCDTLKSEAQLEDSSPFASFCPNTMIGIQRLHWQSFIPDHSLIRAIPRTEDYES